MLAVSCKVNAEILPVGGFPCDNMPFHALCLGCSRDASVHVRLSLCLCESPDGEQLDEEWWQCGPLLLATKSKVHINAGSLQGGRDVQVQWQKENNVPYIAGEQEREISFPASSVVLCGVNFKYIHHGKSIGLSKAFL